LKTSFDMGLVVRMEGIALEESAVMAQWGLVHCRVTCIHQAKEVVAVTVLAAPVVVVAKAETVAKVALVRIKVVLPLRYILAVLP
jgi:hypothetical protein